MTYRTPAPTGDTVQPPTFSECLRGINGLYKRLHDVGHPVTPDEDRVIQNLIGRARANRTSASQSLESVGHFVRAGEHLDAAKREVAAGINTATTQPEMPAASDETPLPAPLPSWRGER